jgi:outer membrane biosynthesis protein TonB
MLEVTSQEKKDKRTALAVSVIFHALLLLLFFFIMAWRAPNPPLEEYGIELNFGMDAAGSGAIQSRAEANETENREDSKPAPKTPEPVKPEVQPKPAAAPAQPEQALATDNDNEVAFKKEEVKPKPEPPKEEVKVVEKPKALYPGKAKSESAGNGTAGTSNKPTGNNNGDDANAVGDKGSPEGKIDAKSLYGKPGGGGGGPSLNMPGWRYDIRPKEDPYENESGKVVFRITIDANGDIENIQVIETNVSPQVVKWYRDQIYKTTFSRTSSKAAADQGATGTITFIIQSR